MALVTCPGCKKQVTNKATTCIYCNSPLSAKRQSPPQRSVGKCPACGSSDTYDGVEQQRKRGGFFGALGARMGNRVAGYGRFRCNKCGHTWEFGKHS